jgi:hypothetical protein
MGEAWSDYFGLELATPEGAPPDGVYPVGEYFLQSWGLGIRTRPYSTNMDVNSLTYAKLGNVVAVPEVHADGEIWFEALWETRAEFIAQFGEREGRRRAAQIIIDGMKLSPPAPSMVDMRDAILLADRTDFKGASQAQIWRAFAKRGLGVLAYSPDGESTAILASNEAPGAPRLAVYRDSQIVGESTLILLSDPANTTNSAEVAVTSSYGDRETSTSLPPWQRFHRHGAYQCFVYGRGWCAGRRQHPANHFGRPHPGRISCVQPAGFRERNGVRPVQSGSGAGSRGLQVCQ